MSRLSAAVVCAWIFATGASAQVSTADLPFASYGLFKEQPIEASIVFDDYKRVAGSIQFVTETGAGAFVLINFYGCSGPIMLAKCETLLIVSYFPGSVSTSALSAVNSLNASSLGAVAFIDEKGRIDVGRRTYVPAPMSKENLRGEIATWFVKHDKVAQALGRTASLPSEGHAKIASAPAKTPGDEIGERVETASLNSGQTNGSSWISNEDKSELREFLESNRAEVEEREGAIAIEN